MWGNHGTRDAALAIIMRTLAVIAALCVATTSRADDRALAADEALHYATPYFSAIRDCYLVHARPQKGSTGRLTLRLVVHRSGDVEQLAIEAPGVTGKRLAALTGCVRVQVAP